MTDAMQWTSALSRRASLEAAVDEAVDRASAALSAPPDLALVFISSAFASEYPRLMPLLRERFERNGALPVLVGCSGAGIVGSREDGTAAELEEAPALNLVLACLPGVQARSFHIATDRLPDLDSPPDAWAELVGVSPADDPHFILLADPSLKDINDLLQGLDYAYPSAVKVGGLASGGMMAAGRSLFADYQRHSEGAVGVALSGPIVLEAIVAQGCRPIGQPYRVVEGEQNILLQVAPQERPDLLGEAGGAVQTPLVALRELIQTLSESDRALAQHSLFVGVARDEFRPTLGAGDFLIRNLIGVDPKAGAVAIGDRIRAGQRIQFHLRDADASAQDLEALLQRYCRDRDPNLPAPAGALMFSCLGRGAELYGKPDFDSSQLQQYLGLLPTGGFFCNGEIGPVGGTTFIHGYTSVFGLLRQP